MCESTTNLTQETTSPTPNDAPAPADNEPQPGLVLAWKPSNIITNDRCKIEGKISVGRSSKCGWCIRDNLLSREHFDVVASAAGFLIRDRSSRNGVSVNGVKLDAPREVPPGTVISAGTCLFVTVADLRKLTSSGGENNGDTRMAGRFHAGHIIHTLRIAARTGRQILLDGETGTGKELAAEKLHDLYREHGRDGRFNVHNAACFAGEDDAVGSLFGVSKGAFTGVGARTGALEESDGGTLFLDEVHALPLRVQRSLLRFVEDGLIQPLGQRSAGKRQCSNVQMLFGTNLDVQRACAEDLLAHDLVARLHRVTIPPLRERRADIPSIFTHLVETHLDDEAASAVLDRFDVHIAELLCRHDYSQGNVRELVDLITVVGARIAEKEPPAQALLDSLDECLGPVETRPSETPSDDDASPYELNRTAILEAYSEVKGNLSRLESTLKERRIPCTRRWLAFYLDRWGVRPIKRRR